jgi:hypothetical protein
MVWYLPMVVHVLTEGVDCPSSPHQLLTIIKACVEMSFEHFDQVFWRLLLSMRQLSLRMMIIHDICGKSKISCIGVLDSSLEGRLTTTTGFIFDLIVSCFGCFLVLLKKLLMIEMKSKSLVTVSHIDVINYEGIGKCNK